VVAAVKPVLSPDGKVPHIQDRPRRCAYRWQVVEALRIAQDGAGEVCEVGATIAIAVGAGGGVDVDDGHAAVEIVLRCDNCVRLVV